MFTSSLLLTLQTSAWIKEQDIDNDGILSYKEFKSAIKAEIERLNTEEE